MNGAYADFFLLVACLLMNGAYFFATVNGSSLQDGWLNGAYVYFFATSFLDG